MSRPPHCASKLQLLRFSVLVWCAVALQAQTAPFTPPANAAGSWLFQADPKLPNVLIVGDSISIGYTRDVRGMLAGKANVFRPMEADSKTPVNCGDTQEGLHDLPRWLGQRRWDVIHFNWGLHDLCYRNPASKLYGHRDKVNGTLSVPLPKYETNLENLVEIIEKTGAKLIWASSTFVPAGEAGRYEGDDVKYNEAATKIMQRHGIQVDDLWALTARFPPASFREPGDVHYTSQAYEKIARQVAASIDRALPERSRRNRAGK